MITYYWYNDSGLALDANWDTLIGNWFYDSGATMQATETPVTGSAVVLLGTSLPISGPAAGVVLDSFDSSQANVGSSLALVVTNSGGFFVTSAITIGISGDTTGIHYYGGGDASTPFTGPTVICRGAANFQGVTSTGWSQVDFYDSATITVSSVALYIVIPYLPITFHNNANMAAGSTADGNVSVNDTAQISGTAGIGTAASGVALTLNNSATCTATGADNSGNICAADVTCNDSSSITSASGTVAGNLILNGSSIVEGNFAVTGTLTANSGTTINMTGTVTGAVIANSATISNSGNWSASADVTLNGTSSFGGTATATVSIAGNLTLNNTASIDNASVTINVTGDTTFNSGTMGAAGSLNSTHIYYGTASNTGLIDYSTLGTYYYGNATLAGGTSGSNNFVNFYNQSSMTSGTASGAVYFYNQSSMTSGTASGAVFYDASSFTGGNLIDSFVWTSAGMCTGGTVGGFPLVIVPLPGPTIVCTPSGGLATSTTSVTLYARGLIQSGATVKFGGVAATSVSFVTSDEISCTAPTGTVGNATIVITNPDASTITQTNGFTYYSTGGGGSFNGVIGG